MEPAELRVELRAQIERFLESGAPLDHLDSHHHVTYLCVPFFQVMLDLAREYNVPVRYPMGDDPASIAARLGLPSDQAERLVAESQADVPTPDRFLDTFYDETATLESLLATLDTLPEGVTELMCHPGYVDGALDGDYFTPREREVSILTHPAVRARIAKQGIKLVTFEVLGQTSDELIGKNIMDLSQISSMYDFKDRTVAITGGAGILGGEIACALAGCRANVVILDRDPALADRLLKRVEGGPGRAIVVYADVLKREPCSRPPTPSSASSAAPTY